MYFSFRKTFALLSTHRRTKSEPLPPVPVAVTHPSQSLSLTKIEELAFSSSSEIKPQPSTSSRPIPSMHEGLLASSRLDSPTPTRQYDTELLALKERVFTLRTENTELKEANAMLKLEAQILEGELTKFRSDYYTERFKANMRRRLASASDDRSKLQSYKLEQAEIFILSLIEIGLHQPVLSQAWEAVRAGQPSDDALVDAIKQAAAVPGTSWSRIIPAITGPRTPEQYISAINLTIKTRKDLNNIKKVAQFWKTTAKKVPALEKTVTPSVSELSAIVNESPDHEKRTAVDDLLVKLKDGNTPLGNPPAVKIKEHDVPAHHPSNPVSCRPQLPTTVPVPLAFNTAVPSQRLLLNSAKVQKHSPASKSHVPLIPELAPLASQVFKDQLPISRRSPRRLRPSPSSKQSRPALGNIDINRNIQKYKTPKKGIEKQDITPSAKALGKRKVTTTEHIYPTTIQTSLHNFSNSPHAILHSSCSINSSTFPTTGSAQIAPSLCKTESLSPEKALLSLERICAGFSSGSFGSLETISEDAEAKTHGSELVSNLPLVDHSLTTTQLVPAPAIRKSILPVLNPRRAASSKKLFLPAHIQPASEPVVSSLSKTVATPTKKFTQKNTSPLRITKKTSTPTISVTSNPGSKKPHTVGHSTSAISTQI